MLEPPSWFDVRVDLGKFRNNVESNDQISLSKFLR
jgi:hypothetical protein